MQPDFGINRTLNIACCVPKLPAEVSKDASFLQQVLIASQLKRKGHQVTYLAPQDLTDVEVSDNLLDRAIARRTWTDTKWFRLASSLSWRIQKLLGIPFLNYSSNIRWFDAYVNCLGGYDIVQERNGLYKNAVAMACRRLHLPYILFFDADDILEHDYLGESIKGLLRWRAEQMVRYNLRTAHRVICVSQATKRRLESVHHTPGGKIEVFPNGVDVNLHRSYPETRMKIRTSFGLEDQPLIVFVGGFYLWHDVTGLLKAFQIVVSSHPEARLLLVGDGQQRQAMELYARQSGIQEKVIFTGTVPFTEVPHLVSAADIAVAPYPKMDRDEFWFSPMKLFEYMACSKAIVASDLGQISEVIKDGQNGLLVPAGNSEAMAVAITRLVENPELRQRLGERARNDAVEKHSWERYAVNLENLYHQVIDEQRR